jgi:hypothetical protein
LLVCDRQEPISIFSFAIDRVLFKTYSRRELIASFAGAVRKLDFSTASKSQHHRTKTPAAQFKNQLKEREMIAKWLQNDRTNRVARKLWRSGLTALLVTGAWSAAAQVQNVPPPPESSFSPAVEVACTALDNPQAFSKRIVPVNPDSETNVRLVVTTDNFPMIDYSVVRSGANAVDFFFRYISTLEPFPYRPIFRCYEFPIGRFSAGTVQIDFVRASRLGNFTGNYVRNATGFAAFNLAVAAALPQQVPTSQGLGVALLALFVAIFARRALRTSGVLSLFLVLTPPPIDMS